MAKKRAIERKENNNKFFTAFKESKQQVVTFMLFWSAAHDSFFFHTGNVSKAAVAIVWNLAKKSLELAKKMRTTKKAKEAFVFLKAVAHLKTKR